MVRIIRTRRKFGKDYRRGIHLFKPNKSELEGAKDRAYSQNFGRIYVHNRK